MTGKVIFGITLILVATALGAGLIYEKLRPGAIIKTENVATAHNSFNNPVAINKANPGNIRDSVDLFAGEIDSPFSDFKSFSSMAYGFRAMIVILRTYYNHYNLKTLAEMISRWAPPEENHTENYIAFVSNNAPFDRDENMQSVLFNGYNENLKNILTCMTWMEQGSGFIVNEDDIRQAVILAA